MQRSHACTEQPEGRSKKRKVNVQRACGSDRGQGVFNELSGGPSAGVLQMKERMVQGELVRRRGPDPAGLGWPSQEFDFILSTTGRRCWISPGKLQ